MFNKKFGIFGIIGAAVLLVVIFFMRNASDTLNAETTISKGQDKFKAGQYQAAINLFNDAIELDDSNYKAYFSRGMSYAKLGELQKAVKDFDKSIELSPESDRATLFFLRGECYFQLDEMDKGCADMKKADQMGQRDAAQFLLNYCN